ncbi:MAG: hypothetical protein HY527_22640 [Betaproteobacteria bacterium]|nr:hypothetical protein [Betaproteobacteria bacterium]
MDVQNNPAGRLYDLLDAARQYPSEEKTKTVWAHVFGVPENDTGSLLKNLADLIDLVHKAKSSIVRLTDVDHKLYLKPFENIETLLSHLNFETHWENWRNRLDDFTLYGLQFGADRLARSSTFTPIKDEQLEALRKELDDLINHVLESPHLPPDLKKLFLRNLEALRQAWSTYRIRGIEGLEQEVERSCGSILLHKEQIRSAAANSAERKLWEGLLKLVDRLSKLVTLAKNAKGIGAQPLVEHIMGR